MLLVPTSIMLACEDAPGADVHHGGGLNSGRPGRLKLQLVIFKSSLPDCWRARESPNPCSHHCPATAQHPDLPLCRDLILLCPTALSLCGEGLRANCVALGAK